MQTKSIILAELGGRLPFKVQDLIKELNVHNDLFDFRALDEKIQIPPQYPTGKHYFAKETLFSLLEDAIQDSGLRFIVGLINEELEGAKFNDHDVTRRIGVVSLAEVEQFCPPERTALQYAAYLVLCEAFCLATGEHLEHYDRNFCLFDECSNKADLTYCLKKPKICDKCRTTALKGFPEDAVGTILNFVRKPAFWKIAKKSLGWRGGAIAAVSASYLFFKFARDAGLPEWLLPLLAAVFLIQILYKYLKAS